MTLKKGYILEIIEKDVCNDLDYEVGTKWIVYDDNPEVSYIEVYDERQLGGLGAVYRECAKQVKLPKQNYKFKVGQIYKVIAQESESPFSKDKFYAVKPARDSRGNYILSENNLKYYANDFGNKVFNTSNTYLELINDIKEPTPKPKTEVKEPTIEVQFLLDYIETEDLCLPEVKAFLKGYLKGERFKHD